MKDKDNIFNDDQLRELLKGARLKPSENLQHRIMHQIKVEESLRYKKTKSASPLLKTITSIAVVFYILVIALCAITYYMGGIQAFMTKEFILSAIGLSSICGIYGLIMVLDEKRYLK